MATISKLVVSLSANSSGLTKVLSKTRKSVAAWAKRAAKAVAVVGAAFSALATVIGGGILIAINKNAAAIDDMTKAASKLHFPIEDFQKFSFIAAKSNISMDSFGTSLQRMQKTIGDAKAGLSTATDALDKLGISASDLDKLNPSQQFELIAERMGGIASQGDKVKIAMDIFGRSGADLLNVFAGDIKGIGDEFDSLGITITQRQADMVAAFQDSKTTLFTLLGGFGRILTVEVAPALEEIVNKTVEWIKEMGGIRPIAISFARAIVVGVKAGVKGFADMTKSLKKVKLSFVDAQAAYLSLKGALLSKITFDGIQFPEEIRKQLDALANERAVINVDLQTSTFGNQTIKNLEDILDSIGIENSNLQDKITILNKDGSIDYIATAKARIDADNGVKDQADKTAKAMSNLTSITNKTAKEAEKGAISSKFQELFDLAKSSKQAGSSFADGNFKSLENLVGALQASGGFGVAEGGEFGKLDMASMVASIESLRNSTSAIASSQQQQAAQQVDGKSLGSLTLNMITNAGEIAGTIWGQDEFIVRLQQFVENNTQQVARATT